MSLQNLEVYSTFYFCTKRHCKMINQLLHVVVWVIVVSCALMCDADTNHTCLQDKDVRSSIEACVNQSAIGNCTVHPYGHISNWCMTNVTTLSSAFANKAEFNTDISQWDTQSVTSFVNTFGYASAFNQSLDAWDTSAVIEFTATFVYANAFNGNIASWNTSAALNFVAMFLGASAFNQPLASWNTGSSSSFGLMFYDAVLFNQPLNSWDTSAATSVSGMFSNANAYNHNVSCWNVSSIDYSAGYFMLYNRSSATTNLQATCWYDYELQNVTSSNCSAANCAQYNDVTYGNALIVSVTNNSVYVAQNDTATAAALICLIVLCLGVFATLLMCSDMTYIPPPIKEASL